MKIALVTLCLNEEKILPFFFRHYDQFVDEYVFFDNMSTDRTEEIIRSHPNTHLIKYNTGGYHMEEVMTLIRNSAYQQLPLDADWYFVVDADEFIYHKDIKSYLKECLDKGITLPKTIGYNMFSDEKPVDDGESQLYDLCPNGLRNDFYSKFSVVHKSIDINFTYGSHHAHPKGNAVFSDEAELKLLHYRYNHIGYSMDDWFDKFKTRFTRRTNELIPRGGMSTNRFAIPDYCLKQYNLPVFYEAFEGRFKELRDAYEQGDAKAAYQLGLVYTIGHVVQKNAAESFKYLERAIELGSDEASYLMGMYYKTGSGVEQNKSKAFSYYIKAAEAGNLEAEFQVGIMLKDGDGVPQDIAEGFSWLNKASEQGHVNSDLVLSLSYNDTPGYVDTELARKHTKLGAEGGNIHCMYNYAVGFYNSGDHVNALKWFRKSAEMGNNGGYDMVDKMYLNEQGKPDDLEGAKEWFEYRLVRQLGHKYL